MISRREFLQTTGGALLVSIANGPVRAAGDQGPFDTRRSHIDPAQLDSWLAIAADGSVTAFTGKCEFGQGILTAQRS
jgi:hypothetical protein